MATQVFSTRRGRITLTDERLTSEPRREPERRISCARVENMEVRVVTHMYWIAPAWTDITIRHGGGALYFTHRTQDRGGAEESAGLLAP